ncbi:sulfur globule protein CV3 domain protein, partial [Ancylostoma duodenale]
HSIELKYVEKQKTLPGYKCESSSGVSRPAAMNTFYFLFASLLAISQMSDASFPYDGYYGGYPWMGYYGLAGHYPYAPFAYGFGYPYGYGL